MGALILTDMITQYDINFLLHKELPQLVINDNPWSVSLEVYNSINHFADYTKHALENRHFITAKKCFALAEKLYINGNHTVQSLIENHFIYAFSSLKFCSSTQEYIVKSIIPKTLYPVYREQLLRSKR